MSTQSILEEVGKEREHQISKGYDVEHDDKHCISSVDKGHVLLPLRAAAISFALASDEFYIPAAHKCWPWSDVLMTQPDSPRDALIKAAAMLVAEIERMDRAATTAKAEEAAG